MLFAPEGVFILGGEDYLQALPIVPVLICGIFRAGGDSKFGFILDSICMWAVVVPSGLISAFVLKLPPLWVYFILFIDEFEKIEIGGTNLKIIQRYIEKVPADSIELIKLDRWTNCNTREDYKIIFNHWRYTN